MAKTLRVLSLMAILIQSTDRILAIGMDMSQLRFSGFYDCKVYGDFLFSVNGVSGLKVYQFDSNKESATSISSVAIPSAICKNVELIKFGNLVVVCVGTAKYVKPSNSYSYDAFDLPSVPSLDFF